MSYEKTAERNLKEIGPSETVDRFLSRHAKLSVRTVYTTHMKLYFRWLKGERDVALSPDELIKDNLVNVFKSDPTDVVTKCKHADWMNEYVNGPLLDRGLGDSKRGIAASTTKGFYWANDSELRSIVKLFRISQVVTLLESELEEFLSERWGLDLAMIRGPTTSRASSYPGRVRSILCPNAKEPQTQTQRRLLARASHRGPYG